MANRHLARSVALQSLFEWDFNAFPENHLKQIVARNTEEFAPGLEDAFFVHQLVTGVAEHRAKLDLIIEKAAPEWPIEKIAVVDRNVLRLGLFELLFANRSEVPARVAINEAIELAKTFGGDNSGKFVNGVLGAVYQEMGEGGKEEPAAKQKRPPADLPYEKLPLEQLVGAVVYCQADKTVKLALVHDIFGYWTLSKGHLLADERPYAGVARKVKEELGLTVEVGEKLGENEYLANNREQGKIRKRVTYFLAQTPSEAALQLTKESGLDDARWFTLAEVPDLKIYDDVMPFVTKAAKILLKK